MQVHNHHERSLATAPEMTGSLLDGLASANDTLWPRHRWPAMRLDRPLQAGAAGGHGPIRYTVESYLPGQTVTFRFTAPRGFNGTHRFVVAPSANGTLLSHDIEMVTSGFSIFSWLFVFRPLHDALLRDAMDQASLTTGGSAQPAPWSCWVRLLRRMFGKRLAKN